MEDAGIACLAFYSLFEEEITYEVLAIGHYLARGRESFAEAITCFPDLGKYNTGVENFLDLIAKAKEYDGILLSS